ncbi:MAG: hypothetical protein ACM3US_16790 [Sphingomonadaceae bacterium]
MNNRRSPLFGAGLGIGIALGFLLGSVLAARASGDPTLIVRSILDRLMHREEGVRFEVLLQ